MPTGTTDVPLTGGAAVGANMVAEPGAVPGQGDDAPPTIPTDPTPPSQPASSGMDIPVPPDVNKEDLVNLLADISQRLKRLEGGTVAEIHTAGGASADKRLRMVERKSFQKLDAYNGQPNQFENWAYKLKGFLQAEPEFRPLLDWIERVAMIEEDESGQRPLTLLGKRIPKPGDDPWQPGSDGGNYEDAIHWADWY